MLEGQRFLERIGRVRVEPKDRNDVGFERTHHPLGLRSVLAGGLCALALAGSDEHAFAAPPGEPPSQPSGEALPRPAAHQRIAARVGFITLLAAPRPDAAPIGLFRAGQSLALRTGVPEVGPNVGPCAQGFYAVEPRGYVCAGDRTTFATDDLQVAAAREVLPSNATPYPYHYGVSKGAVRYRRIPTAAEQRREEWQLEQHLAQVPAPSGPGPSPSIERYFQDVGARLTAEHLTLTGPFSPGGAKLAWADEFVAEGRTFVVTSELEIMPRDAIEELPPVAGAGLLDPVLPMSMGVGAGPRLTRDATAAPEAPLARALVETGQIARRELLPLVTAPRPGDAFVALAAGGYARANDVSTFVPHARPADVGPNDKWIHVSVYAGTLVAYEGDRAVYAALISPGMAGTASNVEFSTPPGRYRIAQKWLTNDMSGRLNGGGWRTREVPFVAYYDGSYALHGAFWHDVFGRPRSHGCINLTPVDARALFGWLEPELPSEWYAVTADAAHPGTTLLVTQ